ncbi:MAG: single-stranded DNA-binding protein [Actinobacteria bacterium]|nr:single-stranded DNA-binding protein [Actinomycetota bacterium]
MSTKKEVEDYSQNEVNMRGRVSGTSIEKVLPSGDKVVEFRIIIARADRSGVDTLDVGAWNARSRRTALTLKEQEWIEITGSVHRRFWQGSTGVASRWQVEASTISRF